MVPTIDSKGCKAIIVFILKIISVPTTIFGILFLILSVTGGIKPVVGWLVAVVCLAPGLYFLVANLRQQRKDAIPVNRGTRWMFALVTIIILSLISSLVAIVIARQGCLSRVGSQSVLNGCDFSGKDFSGMDLSGSAMRYSNLQRVNFSSANLSGVDFTGSDLTGAALEGAILNENEFALSNLTAVTGLSDESLAIAMGVPVEDLYKYTAEKMIRLEDRQQILDTVREACSGHAIPSAHAFESAQTFRTMAVFNAEGKNTNLTEYALNQRWEPMAVRYVDLVACVGDEYKDVIETCNYEEGHTIDRIVYKRDIMVYATRTGEIALITSLVGGQPAFCGTYSSEGQPDLRGLPTNQEQVIEWLSLNVKPAGNP